jgi:hypothetical protein
MTYRFIEAYRSGVRPKARPEPTQLDPATLKTCTKCGASKPVTEFYRDAKGRHGVRGDCKECERARDAARNRTPERRMYRRAWDSWNAFPINARRRDARAAERERAMYEAASPAERAELDADRRMVASRLAHELFCCCAECNPARQKSTERGHSAQV